MYTDSVAQIITGILAAGTAAFYYRQHKAFDR
jgi:hypothetical protein